MPTHGRPRWIVRLVCLAVAVVVIAGAGPASAQPAPTRDLSIGFDELDKPRFACASELAHSGWMSPKTADHPLIGQAWFRSIAERGASPLIALSHREAHGLLLTSSLLASQFVLIGEVHDNPDHHALQATFLRIARCLMRAQPVAAVFEHIRVDQSSALPGPTEPHDTAADALLGRLEWDTSGWPAQSIFRPLFAAAYAAGLAIVPGEPPRGMVRSVARQGLQAVPQPERERLVMATPLPRQHADALRDEIRASHCGMLPESALDGLALAQRYRDAHLADAMIAASKVHETVFLLAGNGHVRKDRGVPWHLRNRSVDARVLSVMLVEVEAGRDDPISYLPRDPEGRPAVDLVIFTARAARADPCEQMRATAPRK